MSAAILQNHFPQGVLAYQSRRQERQAGAELGEVDQDVVRSAAGSGRLAPDVGELFGLRKNVDEFNLVDDPISPGEHAAARSWVSIFHVGKAFDHARLPAPNAL